MQDALFDGMDAGVVASVPTQVTAGESPPRLRRPDRTQALLQPCYLDELIPADHTARLIERAVLRLDLSGFYQWIVARGSEPGRAATDPALLVTLWLYAAIEGIGCGREIARLCASRDDFRWLCGGLAVNYHTLNDFRVDHELALDDLFTSMLALLVAKGLVRVDRISQDGTRVRASAGTSSFHRRATTQALLEKARAYLAGLKEQMDPEVSARRRAAQERAATERVDRLEAAMKELPAIEAARKRWTRGKDKEKPARVSCTDPAVRYMKMSNGGYNPAYNVQLATDVSSRAIVGVAVTSEASDSHESTPMRRQVEERLRRVTGPDGSTPRVKEHLADGGFADAGEVSIAEKAGVTMYVPPRKRKLKGGVNTLTGVLASDSPEVVRWRQRMATPEAKAIYDQRGQTIETANADLKTHRALGPFQVRGLNKVRCVALWSALAYNLLHFAPALLT